MIIAADHGSFTQGELAFDADGFVTSTGLSRTRRVRQLIMACHNGGTTRQQHWRCPRGQVLRRPGQPELVTWVTGGCRRRGAPAAAREGTQFPDADLDCAAGLPRPDAPARASNPVQPLRSPLRAGHKQPNTAIRSPHRNGRCAWWPQLAAGSGSGCWRVLGGGLRAGHAWRRSFPRTPRLARRACASAALRRGKRPAMRGLNRPAASSPRIALTAAARSCWLAR
jgi:hypothetical protein